MKRVGGDCGGDDLDIEVHGCQAIDANNFTPRYIWDCKEAKVVWTSWGGAL